jgi:hypothetical protein
MLFGLLPYFFHWGLGVQSRRLSNALLTREVFSVSWKLQTRVQDGDQAHTEKLGAKPGSRKRNIDRDRQQSIDNKDCEGGGPPK